MKRIMIFVVLLAMFGSSVVNAEEKWIRGKVIRIVAADTAFGSCMVSLNVSVAAALTGCNGNWVTFSCNGHFTAKDIAYRKFDMAQMAKALDRSIGVMVDNTKKHGTICYASRIDIY